MKKYYKLPNGYPLRVELTGEKVIPPNDGVTHIPLYLAKCMETRYGFEKGEIIEVSNLWLYDKI